ncbi:MAG: CDP-alcohol phosphatidyltransferase family protein [Nitrososphaerota archaeon]
MNYKRTIEKNLLKKISTNIIKLLVERNVNPFTLTYMALVFSILSGCLYSLANLSETFVAIGGVVLLLSGFLDALDGELARATNRTTQKGSFLDSVFDKLGEVSVSLGIAISGRVSSIIVTLFISCSLLVSYIRAKADQHNINIAGAGIAERAERIIIIALASLLYPFFSQSLQYGLLLTTFLSIITIGQRIVYVYNRLK